MWNVKSTMLFVASLVVVILISLSMANAEEKQKTYTPKETIQAFAEVPSKVGNWFTGEVEKTKEFQKKSFAEAKTKWPWNVIFKGKDNE